MTKDDVIRMAHEAGLHLATDVNWMPIVGFEYAEKFATLVSAAEREECAEVVGEAAKKWWSIHCATNKHMETTRKAHDAFCALQAAIRARGNT